MKPQVDYRFAVDVLGDAASVLSFWPQVKDDPELGPDEALSALATWSHLDRFPPESLDQSVVGEFNALVARDAPALVACFSHLTFIDDWLDELERLDESWDWITENDDGDQANLGAARLFRTLDQFSLAYHASQRILRDDDAPGEQKADLDVIGQEVAEGERLLREQPDIFLGAAVLASAQFGQFRNDLLEYDDRLWETTLKHQVLDELLEERDAEPTQRLTQHEIDELLSVARTVKPTLQPIPIIVILPLLRNLRARPQRHAAAATHRDDSADEMQLEFANHKIPVSDDPAVQMELIPEIDDTGELSGLDISLEGDRQEVSRYVEAVLISESMKKPRVIDLRESGFGTLCFDDDVEKEELLRSDPLKIVLRDNHDQEHLVLVR